MSRFIFVVFMFIFATQLQAANEEVPDDIRYMLEDMYGADKKAWPSPRYSTDLNKDGHADWVVVKKGCMSEQGCPAEIFLCLADEKGKCVEYCYSEVVNLKKFVPGISHIKCQSTC